MNLGRPFLSISSLLPVLMCISANARVNLSATTASVITENWIPSDEFSNTSSINWFARKGDDNVEAIESSFARNFQNDDSTSVDRAFNNFVNYNSEFDERDDYKAIPFQIPELISASNGNGNGNANSNPNDNAPVHFHNTLFQQQPPPQQHQQQQQQQQLLLQQQQQQLSGIAKPSYPAGIASSAQTSPYSPNSAATISVSSSIPHSQPLSNVYHRPYQTVSQNLENFDYLPSAPAPAPYPHPPQYPYPHPYPYPIRFTDNATNLELNTRHLLFLQPGKCSNSIQVGRLRDLEIKSTVKSGTGTVDSQKAICVLMLYSANENNKLAISMQSALDTASAELAAENWLESNVKVYSLQGGAITRIATNANFGPGSSALILTKSSIVLLSIVSDRTLDFQIDISTYQSNHC